MGLRDDIKAAAESLESGAEPPEAEPLAEATPANDNALAPTADAANDNAETPAQAAARARDEKGRFAPKKADGDSTPAAPTKAAPELGVPATPPATPLPAVKPGAAEPGAAPVPFKPPQSWKPAAREKLLTADPEIQAEVMRREQEMQQGIQSTAEQRRMAEGFQRVLEPYGQMLQGQDPTNVVREALHLGQTLHYGTPEQKAQTLAHLFTQFGVDIDTFAKAVDGTAANDNQAQGQAQLPPQIAQQLQRFDSYIRSQEQAQQQQLSSQVEAFAAKNEFFHDVQPRMAGLIKAGLAKDLDDAYHQACWADPGIRQVLQRREAATQANAQTASTQRSQAAALSVKSNPAGGTTAGSAEGSTLRGAIRAAISAHREG